MILSKKQAVDSLANWMSSPGIVLKSQHSNLSACLPVPARQTGNAQVDMWCCIYTTDFKKPKNPPIVLLHYRRT